MTRFEAGRGGVGETGPPQSALQRRGAGRAALAVAALKDRHLRATGTTVNHEQHHLLSWTLVHGVSRSPTSHFSK